MKVGLTLSLHDVQVVEIGGESFAEKEWRMSFLHYLPYIQEDDFSRSTELYAFSFWKRGKNGESCRCRIDTDEL